MVLACRTTMPILHAAVETLGAGVHGLDDRPPSPSRQAEGTEAPAWHHSTSAVHGLNAWPSSPSRQARGGCFVTGRHGTSAIHGLDA